MITAEGGGPLGSRHACKHCPKVKADPGHHDKFIEVKDFGVHCLSPLDSRLLLSREDVVEYIQEVVPLVVRLCVPIISQDRPDTWHEKYSYPLCEYRGKRVNATGSGYVMSVTKGSDICTEYKCRICKETTLENDKVWEIHIVTARHVIFDDFEASDCAILFFDDWPSNPDQFLVKGAILEKAKENQDFSSMLCHIHDEHVGDKLMKHFNVSSEMICRLQERYELQDLEGGDINSSGDSDSDIGYETTVNDTFSSIIFDDTTIPERTPIDMDSLTNRRTNDMDGCPSTEDNPAYSSHFSLEDVLTAPSLFTFDAGDEDYDAESVKSDDSLEEIDTTENEIAPVILISHPHGRMKYISIGRFRGQKWRDTATYDAPSCVGSSGGLVVTFGKKNREKLTNRFWSRQIDCHPHSVVVNQWTGNSVPRGGYW